MSRAEQAADRAARWLLAQEEQSWAPADQAMLDAWLAESEGNRTAYLRLRHSWREADRIAAQNLTNASGQAGRAMQRPVFRRALPLALAASIALLVGSAVVLRQSPPPLAPQGTATSYATPVGGGRVIGIADGSKVQLNTASRVRASVSPDRREVWLDQGEAFFEVAHKNGQPFIVHAGDRQITVLGTKFSVRREGTRVTVSVLEGRVRIDEIQNGEAVRSSVIVGGDIAIAEGTATMLTSRSDQKVEDALAWRQGMLSFDQTDLGEIAAEFNRYNERKLRIADPEAAAIRIGGMFPAHDPGAFARLLRDAYGLKLQVSPGEISISS